MFYQAWLKETLVASGLFEVFLFLMLPYHRKTLEGSIKPQNLPNKTEVGGELQQALLVLKQNFFVFSHLIMFWAFIITHAFICISVSLYRQGFSVDVCKLGTIYPIPHLDSAGDGQKQAGV